MLRQRVCEAIAATSRGIVVVEIMTDKLDRVWWAQFRKWQENQLSEDEIIIRVTEIEWL